MPRQLHAGHGLEALDREVGRCLSRIRRRPAERAARAGAASSRHPRALHLPGPRHAPTPLRAGTLARVAHLSRLTLHAFALLLFLFYLYHAPAYRGAQINALHEVLANARRTLEAIAGAKFESLREQKQRQSQGDSSDDDKLHRVPPASMKSAM